MNKVLKWVAIALGILVVIGFIAFLYIIPPFTIAPPETFSGPEIAAAPSLDQIRDQARKMFAERGRYLVTSIGCTGCHTPGGDSGPNWQKYMAGGTRQVLRGSGVYVSRNLTPDSATGLARYSDEEIVRVLRNGLFHDGSVIPGQIMPWPAWSNWSEEDLRAVVAYLRCLNPVRQRIPDNAPVQAENGGPLVKFFAGDYGATGQHP